MPAASAVTDALKDAAPDLPVILVGGHVASLPERTLAEERCDFVADGEGLYTLVDLLDALASGTSPDLSKVRSLWRREGKGAYCTDVAGAARAGPRPRDAGHRVGSAADGALPRPQLALLRRAEPAALRLALHDARLSLPVLVLLHPGAVQERRSGGRLQGEREQLPVLEPGARARRPDAPRRALRRPQRQDRRRAVRAERPPRGRASATASSSAASTSTSGPTRASTPSRTA